MRTGCSRRGPSTSRSPASSRSTPCAGPSSGSSASRACTSRPRAAARRARSSWSRSTPPTSSGAAGRDRRAAARGGRGRAGAGDDARLERRRAARRRAHLGPGRRAGARARGGAAGDRPARGRRPRGRRPRGRAARPRHGGRVAARRRRAAAVAWLLAILGTIAAFAGFEVTRRGERLRIRRGLVARRESTVTGRRACRPCSWSRGSCGGRSGSPRCASRCAGFKAEAAAAQTLFPLLRRRDVPGSWRRCCPSTPTRSTASRRRRRGRGAATCSRPRSPGWRSARRCGSRSRRPGRGRSPSRRRAPRRARSPGAPRAGGWRAAALAVRSRRLARVTVLAPAGALQEVARSQSPLQRRGRLADLHVAVGAGTRARVRHLDERRRRRRVRRAAVTDGQDAAAGTGSGRTTTVSSTGMISSAIISEARAWARMCSGLSAS